MSEMKSTSERALLACGLWLHVGFIGSAALAIGVIRLFDGAASLLAGLPMVVIGGTLAVAGWRRATAILKQTEGEPAAAPPVPRQASVLTLSSQARLRLSHATSHSVAGRSEPRP